jgi:hypothetical protein
LAEFFLVGPAGDGMGGTMTTDDPIPAPGDDDDDDLFRPSLEARADEVHEGAPRPWSVKPQLFVAFFGGVLALGAIAWQNSGRLGMAPSRRRLIVVTCGVCFVAVVVIGAVLFGMGTDSDATRQARLGSRLVAVGAYLVCERLQRPWERAYRLRRGDNAFESLWKPGIAAVVVLGVVQALLLASLRLVA